MKLWITDRIDENCESNNSFGFVYYFTVQAINKKILDYGELSANIVTVDAQESYNGGVFVLVTGFLTGKDNIRKKFTQSFFLAPQDVGYFVLNDVFRYVDDSTPQNGDNGLVVDAAVEAPLTPKHGIHDSYWNVKVCTFVSSNLVWFLL